MSIKSISSTNKARINTMYVNRNIEINQINSIQPIRKSNKLHNDSFQSSENNFFGASIFYEHLKKLKEKYFHFYQIQQKLEDALNKFIHTNYKDLFAALKDLVVRYNHAILSLKDFDAYFGTNHSQNIYNILFSYKLSLEKIGLSLHEDYKLSICEPTLLNALQENKNAIAFLFNTKNGLIRILYNAFKEIKVPTFKNPYSTTNHAPSIIDEKR